ncbi:MAG TPA: WD40 repeat domain-containing protein, partial [Planctomycetota bacterium]|nr:WD40 repeat domain-containing protein [Planctomycetota bacterium]
REALARYASSAELADDLRAFLEERVVRAHASGPVAEFRKWFRRNRAAALAGSAALLVAAAGLVATVLVQARANEQLEVRGAEARDARDAALVAQSELRAANSELERAHDLEVERREALERSEYAANLAAAAAGLRLGDVGEARVRLEACAESLRAWEWRHLWRAANASTRELWGGDPRALRVLAHPGGELLALAFESGPLRLVRAADGEVVGEFAPADDVQGRLAFTPDGEVLARVAGDRSVHRVRIADGTWLAPIAAQRRPLTALAFSPDGRVLATAASDKSVRLWDVASGDELAVLEAHSGYATDLAFTPDGRGLISGARDRRVLLWDVADGALVREFEGCEHPVMFVSVSPDGRELAAGSSLGALDRSRAGDALANSVRIWDLGSGVLRASLPTASNPIAAGGYSSDGSWLGAVSLDGAVRRWGRRSGRTRTFVGQSGGAPDLAVGPDGEWLAAVDGSGRVLRWDVEVCQGLSLRGQAGDLTALAFAPDGSRLYSGSLDQTLRAWGSAHGELEALWRLPNFGVVHAALTPDGGTLVCVQTDGAVRAFDTRSGRQLSVTGASDDGRMRIAQFAPAFALASSGERYVLAGRTQPIELRTLADGELVRSFERELDISLALALDPRERWLAHSELRLATRESLLVVRDLDSGTELLRRTPVSQVGTLAFAPDGSLLAYGSGRDVVLIGCADWNERATLGGHPASVTALAFTPDGRRLVSGASDGRLRVWDTADGTALLTLEAPGGEVRALAFDVEERLAIALGDWSVSLWDHGPVEPRVTARAAERAARAGVFDRLDGVFAAAATPAAAVARLRADPTLEPGALRAALTLAGLVHADPGDQWSDGWGAVRAPGGEREALHMAAWSAQLARRTAPDDVDAALVRGAALLRLGRTPDALEPLLAAQRLLREAGTRARVEVETLLGLALTANGRPDEAREHLARARELMQIPTVAMRPDAQALVRELELALGAD